jgi:hypothetical protein
VARSHGAPRSQRVRAIIDEPLVDERVMVEQRSGAIPHEKVHGRVRECAAQIVQQRRRQHDVAETSKLCDENAARMRDARRLHSDSRHSFAYCVKA